MSICPACNGTGPVGAVLGVVCGRCDGSGEVCDAAAQTETKGGETMNDDKLRVTVDLATPELLVKYAELMEGALALASLYRNALAAVPWPGLRNMEDWEKGGDAWNRPVSIDAWEREYGEVLLQAMRESVAQMVEFDALRAECDRLRNINQTYEAENRAQRTERDAAQAEAAHYKALWDAIPWNDLRAVHWHMPIGAPVQPFKRVDVWLKNNAPQPEQEPQP